MLFLERDFNDFKVKTTHAIIMLLLIISQACSDKDQETKAIELPAKESFTVIAGGNKVGYLNISRSGDTLISDYDYKNNGRGPSIKDTLILDGNGFPIKWDIEGTTTFGNSISEHYLYDGKTAIWTDATGSAEAIVNNPSLYIDQFGGPYSTFIKARVLLNSENNTVSALPAGQLQLTEMESLKTLNTDSSELKLTSYAISGASMNPTYFILDENQMFFALINPGFIIIRSGFEAEEKRMRMFSEKYAAKRFEDLQAKFAHKYEKDVRISNVRIFDPKSLALTELSSVLVRGDKILSIDAPEKNAENETVIDGEGGVLVPGLYDMHAHMGDNSAMLNVLAGVTNMRDMGNQNEVLDSLIQKIESGVLAGPRITRLGFIEGKSPFNSNNGILVESEKEALEAVDTYYKMGFYGVKLYNSMNGDWAPAIAKKAHELGMFVCGHVPAFSNADAMLNAGYDEMTHINQVMLGWVLEPEEDTRTLLRLTAMKRFVDLDLEGPRVNKTLDLMVKNKVGIDPTLAIHEYLMLARNGETRKGVLDYIENMPVNEQRGAKVALSNIADEEEDEAYRLAYAKIVEVLKIMKDRGILTVPGTDLGGAFNLHRELELYQELGYTPAELLRLGSYDMAQYLKHEDRGIIETGKLADFFLIPGDPLKDIKAIKTISMVSRGGVIYYPSEVYPSFGIKPFVEMPSVVE